MPRKPMVTRTLTVTNVEVLVVNKATEKIDTVYVEIGRCLGEKDLLKKVKTIVETPDIKVVEVTVKSVYKKLCGMTEEEFIKNAIELNAETSDLNKRVLLSYYKRCRSQNNSKHLI